MHVKEKSTLMETGVLHHCNFEGDQQPSERVSGIVEYDVIQV